MFGRPSKQMMESYAGKRRCPCSCTARGTEKLWMTDGGWRLVCAECQVEWETRWLEPFAATITR